MFQPTYTVSDLDAQLTHARAMMRANGMPDLRLTRTCDDDYTLGRMIEDRDPFCQQDPYQAIADRLMVRAILNDESPDALDHAIFCNPDAIEAQAIDPVAYFETEACASLDDEIENWERVTGTLPFPHGHIHCTCVECD